MQTLLSITTPRLRLRRVCLDDAQFLFSLMNDPAWLRYIGDRQIRDIAAAEKYIQAHILPVYQQHHLGPLIVQRRDDPTPLGLAGLFLRDYLPAPDIGFALLPAARGHGVALEAAQSVLQRAVSEGHTRILAMANPSNAASLALLRQLGFQAVPSSLLMTHAASPAVAPGAVEQDATCYFQWRMDSEQE